MNITATVSEKDIKDAIVQWLSKESIQVQSSDVIFNVIPGYSDQREGKSSPDVVTATVVIRNINK